VWWPLKARPPARHCQARRAVQSPQESAGGPAADPCPRGHGRFPQRHALAKKILLPNFAILAALRETSQFSFSQRRKARKDLVPSRRHLSYANRPQRRSDARKQPTSLGCDSRKGDSVVAAQGQATRPSLRSPKGCGNPLKNQPVARRQIRARGDTGDSHSATRLLRRSCFPTFRSWRLCVKHPNSVSRKGQRSQRSCAITPSPFLRKSSPTAVGCSQ